MTTLSPVNASLYSSLITQMAGQLPVIQCTKATLVHLSHTLEDLVLTHQLPAMVFTGFQESSHWRKETQRYQAIANVAQQVCIFAGRPLPEESNARQLHVQLADNDPLRQEWFLIILSSHFSVLLCGQDNQSGSPDEATREFDTIFTFDPAMINPALDILETVIESYRPQKLQAIQDARQRFTPGLPDENLLLQFTTQLIQFEEKLNSQLREKQHLIDTVLDAVNYHLYVTEITTNNTMQRIYSSLNLNVITGYSDEALREQGFWMAHVHPEDREKASLIETRLIDQTTDVVDYRFRHAHGHYIWLRNHASISWDHNRQKWMIYGVMQDITAQKELEHMRQMQHQLQTALEAERQLNAAKSYLMYTISHEFRTPLATILSSTELMERYSERMDKATIDTKLRTIRDQVLHLNSLLEDINDIVNDQINQQGIHPVAIDAQRFAEYVIRDREFTRDSTHEIAYHYHGAPGRYTLDPRLFRQIITNLLSNAVKYSTGTSPVSCDIHTSDHWLILRVSDQGIGIPLEDQSQIFEPFHRAANVDAIGGTGLGLKIVQDCVQAHNGTITLVSQVNQGTTFTVYLPTSPA